MDFWNERAANLNSIQQQLSSERIKKVAKVLELVKSTYYPAFARYASAAVELSCHNNMLCSSDTSCRRTLSSQLYCSRRQGAYGVTLVQLLSSLMQIC